MKKILMIIDRYRIKSLVFSLLLAIFLVTSVYAWFTSNITVMINTLDLRLQAGEGLQISVDGLNWKYEIEANELLGEAIDKAYSAHENHLTDEFRPVSSAGFTDDTGFMEMFLGESIALTEEGDYGLVAEKLTDKRDTKNYIAFDIFLKTDFDVYLYLAEDAGIIDTAVEGIGRRDKGMENSARVAFVEQGHIPLSSPLRGDALGYAAQGLKYTEYQDGRNVKIWEPNYDAHTEEAKMEKSDLFGISEHDSIWNGIIQYDAIYRNITYGRSISLQDNNANAYPEYFTRIPEDRFIRTPARGITGYADTGIILKAGVTKFRIYMWIEGQDWDCRE